MPRVEYTTSAGLVQRTGTGFALNNIKTVSGNTGVTLDGSETIVISTGGTQAITLPTDENSHTGQVIIVITTSTDANTVATTNASTGALQMDTIGDMAICVYDGSQWVVGASIA